MLAVPIKPEYGPTLGQLLSPRWRSASPLTRRVLTATGIGLLALAVGAALSLQNASFSHGGKVSFGFAYRGLWKVAPEPGGYVRIERRRAGGALEDSYAVRPLVLPPYAGEQSGELPVYASGYIRELAGRDPGFVLRGEGKTRVNAVPAYQVLYTALVGGRPMYGRDVLLLPERRGVREGVEIVMLTSPTANAQVDSPLEVAGTGVLLRPLKTFSFG
jgi:hypothetical protein